MSLLGRFLSSRLLRRRLAEDLLHRHHPMLACPGVDGLAEGNRFEVVASADFGLRVVLDRAEELRHGADEGVREPDLLPARRDPAPGLPLGAEIERAWRACRVVRPTDGAAGK